MENRMLVLKRKVAEKIVLLDGLIEIEVINIDGRSAMIGVTAPVEVPVHRKEVQAAIEKENKLPRFNLLEVLQALRRLNKVIT